MRICEGRGAGGEGVEIEVDGGEGRSVECW